MSENGNKPSGKPVLSIVTTSAPSAPPEVPLDRQIFNFITTTDSFNDWIKLRPSYNGALKNLAPEFNQACAAYLPLPDNADDVINGFFNALENLDKKSQIYIHALKREITKINCSANTAAPQFNTRKVFEKSTQPYKDKAALAILIMHDICNILQHDANSSIIPSHLRRDIDVKSAKYQNLLNHGINTISSDRTALEIAQNEHQNAFNAFTRATAQLAAYGPYKFWNEMPGNNKDTTNVININPNSQKRHDNPFINHHIKTALSILSALFWPKLPTKQDGRLSLYDANFTSSKLAGKNQLTLVT